MAGLKRKIIRKIGDGLGLEIYKKSNVDEWREIAFMTDLFEALEVDCVFDVGANKGQFGQLLRKSGYTGPILSFEPGPDAFGTLEKVSAGDPHWHVFNAALGSVPGTMPFNIMKWDVFSSFRRPTKEEELAYSDVNIVERVVDVEVQTLDGCFEKLQRDYGFAHPFIKMDTQGFDLEVLKGAQSVIGRFVGLLSEVSTSKLYDDSPTIVDSLAYFRDAGFSVVGMYSVHPEDILNPLEFNCYAARRATAG